MEVTRDMIEKEMQTVRKATLYDLRLIFTSGEKKAVFNGRTRGIARQDSACQRARIKETGNSRKGGLATALSVKIE